MEKNNKGITLIALVITIIVMLILVSVTINMAVNGGLFEYAGRAAAETEAAKEQEKAILDVESNLTPEQLMFKYETFGLSVTLYGDANDDGRVQLKDSTLIKQYLAGNAGISAQGKLNSDVNLDGVLDEKDSRIMEKYVAGIITELPWTEAIPE